MRREKSLRIGVHHANAVVWGPVRDGTRLRDHGRAEVDVHGEEKEASRAILERVVDDAEYALFVRANVVLGDDVEPASAARALAVDLNRRGGEEGETGSSAGSVGVSRRRKKVRPLSRYFFERPARASDLTRRPAARAPRVARSRRPRVRARPLKHLARDRGSRARAASARTRPRDISKGRANG